MAAYLCVIALIFVVINLVVDLLYFAVDPRLRIETAGRSALMLQAMSPTSQSAPIGALLALRTAS